MDRNEAWSSRMIGGRRKRTEADSVTWTCKKYKGCHWLKSFPTKDGLKYVETWKRSKNKLSR